MTARKRSSNSLGPFSASQLVDAETMSAEDIAAYTFPPSIQGGQNSGEGDGPHSGRDSQSACEPGWRHVNLTMNADAPTLHSTTYGQRGQGDQSERATGRGRKAAIEAANATVQDRIINRKIFAMSRSGLKTMASATKPAAQ